MTSGHFSESSECPKTADSATHLFVSVKLDYVSHISELLGESMPRGGRSSSCLLSLQMRCEHCGHVIQNVVLVSVSWSHLSWWVRTHVSGKHRFTFIETLVLRMISQLQTTPHLKGLVQWIWWQICLDKSVVFTLQWLISHQKYFQEQWPSFFFPFVWIDTDH